MNNDGMETELIRAARDGDAESVRALIEAGADIHVNDDEPLRQAAWCNRVAVLKLLIEAGADVNAGGWLALRWAVAGRNDEATAVLQDAIRKTRESLAPVSIAPDGPR